MFEIIKTVAAATRADQYFTAGGTGDTSKGIQTGNDASGDNGLMGIVNTIINVALGVIGLIAVVMIILGGVQYTTSSGDAAKVKKAKDTIMYGIIGLVVALLAFAIVNFVLKGVFGIS